MRSEKETISGYSKQWCIKRGIGLHCGCSLCEGVEKVRQLRCEVGGDEVKITIDIIPQGAVRMTNRSKWVNAYAQRYMNYKNTIGWAVREHIKKPIDAPVSVDMTFYYPIPKSWSKAAKEDARNARRLPIVKPDLDNCVKAIFDSLNGIAYVDDNRVVRESSSKWYSDHPRIEIEILEVGA